MPDKRSLDVNRIWNPSIASGNRVWVPEVARSPMLIPIGANVWDPSDDDYLVFGNLYGLPPQDPLLVYPWIAAIVLPCDLLVSRVDVNWYSVGVAGSSEAIKLYITYYRDEVAHPTLVDSVYNSEALKTFSLVDMNLVLLVGDLVCMVIECPTTWATNPTDVYLSGTIFGWAA